MPSMFAEDLQHIRRLTASGEARSIRRLARLSQAEVGRSIGADTSTISRWESGQRRPRGECAIRYLRLLLRLSRDVA